MLDENAAYSSHLLKCTDSTSHTRKGVRGAAGTAGYRRGQVEGWGAQRAASPAQMA